MASEKVISFDLRADFSFFKKPDINDGLQLSYNMLHKPALLGVLGAIIGLAGYQKKGELPEYYRLLGEIPLGIAPVTGYHERGNYWKTSVKYTNGVGYANEDGNLIIEETMLIRPAYRCYVLLNSGEALHNKLLHYLGAEYAEFIPYLGNNEFHAWIENVCEWKVEAFNPKGNFRIDSLFMKEGSIRGQRVQASLDLAFDEIDSFGSFSYFERLPVGFDEVLFQYQLGDFVFTDWKLKPNTMISSLFQITSNDEIKTVQLI